jgi:hypothetical protein
MDELRDKEGRGGGPHHGGRTLEIIIIVDGEPVRKSFPPDEKVEKVIKDLLHGGEKDKWADWQLTLGTKVLDPNLSLEANGVGSGSTLAFTKKEGGGGAY